MTIALGVLCVVTVAQMVILVSNLIYWRRRRPDADGSDVRISVLIPARNEVDNMPLLLSALADQAHSATEIIVCDDGSDDGTREWLAENADTLGVQWFRSAERPDGWVGKTWACHQLGQRASGEWLLFLDADTRPKPDFLALMAAAFADTDALLVTVLPNLPPAGVGDALIVGMVPFGVLTSLPLWLAERHPNPGLAFANGQALAFRREDYLELLPHQRTKWAFVEDMQLAQMTKRMGKQVRIVDARRALDVRMYGSTSEALDGFSKNAAEITRGPIRSLVIAAGVMVVGALPLAGAALGYALGPAIIAANVLLFGAVWGMFGMSPLLGLLYPVALLLTVVILIRSAYWHLTGHIQWKGRTYSTGSRAG